MNTRHTSKATLALFLLSVTRALPAKPWPAEPWRSAKILTHLDADFQNNMSGACWNPETKTYWVSCNGKPSAFWALKQDAAGSWIIASNKASEKAKYNIGQGDLEGICQIDYKKDLIYLLLEKTGKIVEYDTSLYGKINAKRTWNIAAHLPTKGGKGPEGITFVPNHWLNKEGFTDKNGNPYISTNAMEGLMFIAHQNGGKIYVFDLSSKGDSVHLVGAYKTSRAESAGLEFDRTTGLLYIWHNIDQNYLEITKLSSQKDGNERRLTTLAEYIGPKTGNLEGIALSPAGKGKQHILLVDDNNQDDAALMWFQQFDPTEALKKTDQK